MGSAGLGGGAVHTPIHITYTALGPGQACTSYTYPTPEAGHDLGKGRYQAPYSSISVTLGVMGQLVKK